MPLCKFCAHPGCNKIISQAKTYCIKHTITKAEKNKEYDAKYRNKQSKTFYNSQAWKITRNKVLALDNHMDLYIYETEKRIVRATMVHHIIEYKEEPGKGLDFNNLISVSEETHEGIIKKMYSNEAKKREMQKKLLEIVKKYRNLGGVQGA